MNEAMLQQIVEAVLKEMNVSGSGCSPCQEGLCRMLVIGDASQVPADVAKDCQALTIEDYIQYKNIHRYGKVVITALSLTDLSDIALGRDSSPASCAVVNALLAGIDVCMTEKALPHRKYSGRSSSRLYQIIENNVKLIQTCGVRLLKEECVRQEIPAKPAKFQAPPVAVPKGNACVNSEKLITEVLARQIAEKAGSSVCIASDAIVTPSAWDVFKQKGITVTRQ